MDTRTTTALDSATSLDCEKSHNKMSTNTQQEVGLISRRAVPNTTSATTVQRLMEQFLHQQLKIRRKSETNTGGCFYHKRWNKNQVDWHWAPRDWSVSGGHTEAASGGHSISAGANAPDCERSTCKQGLRWNRRSVTAPPPYCSFISSI